MADDIRNDIMGSVGQLNAQQGDFGPMLGNISKRFPALAPHVKNTVVQWGPERNDGRQMETYPPWETDNPNPGKITLEYYNRKLAGPDMENAAAADLLHIAGGVHPETRQPIDPIYRGFKDQLRTSLTPDQLAVDQQAYDRAKTGDGEARPFDDWMDQSRVDAYMRAGLFPEQNPAWKDTLNPAQTDIMSQAMRYLQGTPNQ